MQKVMRSVYFKRSVLKFALSRIATVRENELVFFFKVAESQVRECLNPRSKSMNFILKLLQPDYFVSCLLIDRPFSFKNYLLLIQGQNNHPERSLKIALQSVKSQVLYFFRCMSGNPDY